MIVNLKNLKSVLKSKISEYEMLNKTLLEMVEKGSSKESIKDMRNAIDETQNYIKNLQMDIEDMELEEEKTKDSFYNHIKKPTLAKSIKLKKAKDEFKKTMEDGEEMLNKLTSFYDSINKMKKSDFAPYDTPYNKLGKEDKYAADSVKVEKNGSFYSPYDEAMSANRFLVRFEGNVNVPEYYVRRVSFSPSDRKEIYVQIFDFLTEDNRPIITEFNNQNMPFRISIDHLDPTGVVLYTERYHGCNVMEIMKSDLAYDLDEKSTMELRITYSDVSYETTH